MPFNAATARPVSAGAPPKAKGFNPATAKKIALPQEEQSGIGSLLSDIGTRALDAGKAAVGIGGLRAADLFVTGIPDLAARGVRGGLRAVGAEAAAESITPVKDTEFYQRDYRPRMLEAQQMVRDTYSPEAQAEIAAASRESASASAKRAALEAQMDDDFTNNVGGFVDGVVSGAKSLIENPRALAATVGESLPEMAVGVSAAGALAAPKAKAAYDLMVRAGASPQLAAKVAAKAGSARATAGAVGSESLSAGSASADTAGEAFDAVSDDELMEVSPAFQQMAAKVGAVQARAAMRADIMNRAAAMSAATTAGVSLASGAGGQMGKIATRQSMGSAAEAGRGRIESALVGATKEGADEFGQEYLDAVAQNVAVSSSGADPTRSATQGAAEQGGAGMLAGVAMGGPMGMLAEGPRAAKPAQPAAAQIPSVLQRFWLNKGVNPKLADLFARKAEDRSFKERRQPTVDDLLAGIDESSDSELGEASQTYAGMRSSGLSEKAARAAMKADLLDGELDGKAANGTVTATLPNGVSGTSTGLDADQATDDALADLEAREDAAEAQQLQQDLPNAATGLSDAALAGVGANDAPAVEPSEFVSFPKETGTLEIPRAEMPQVKAEHRGAMVNFLNARGVTHEATEIDPQTLKPTQAEFSPAKVEKARSFSGSERSILVSSDGHIVDGHHQAIAALDAGKPIKAIVLNAPIRELLPMVKEFPSSKADAEMRRPQQSPNAAPNPAPSGVFNGRQNQPTQAQGGQPPPSVTAPKVDDVDPFAPSAGSQPSAAPAGRKAKVKRPTSSREMADGARKSLLGEIRAMGGIDRREMADITGEGRRDPKTGKISTRAGGQVNRLFTNKGVTLDKLRERMAELGYFNDDGDVTGDLDQVREIVRAALDGDGEGALPMSMRAEYADLKAMERAAADEIAASLEQNQIEKQRAALQYEADELLGEDERADIADRFGDDELEYFQKLQEAINAQRSRNESDDGGQDDAQAGGSENSGARQGSRTGGSRQAGQQLGREDQAGFALEQQTEADLAAKAAREAGPVDEDAARRQSEADDAAKAANTAKQRGLLPASELVRATDQKREAAVRNSPDAGVGGGLFSGPKVKPAATPNRYEVGAALTKEQRKAVLKTLVDVYKDKGAQRESKGNGQDGNERVGYVHSPDLFEKSAITGAMVRYHVTLPDGRIAHPSELFPDYTQKDIDKALSAQRFAEQNEAFNAKAALKAADEFSADSVDAANAIFRKNNPNNTGAAIESSALYEKKGKFYRSGNVNNLTRLPANGWSIRAVNEGLEAFAKTKGVEYSSAKPEAPPISGKLENFGEALPPARRAIKSSLSDELTDADIASKPLSEIWPASEIEAIEDPYTAAVAFAARAEIPAKPRVGYKVDRWVEKVKLMRSLAGFIQRDVLDAERFNEKLRNARGLEQFANKVALLEGIDRSQWKRVGSVEVYPNAYRFEGDAKIPSGFTQVEIDGSRQRLSGVLSVADAIEPVNKLLGVEAQAKKMQFEVRGRDPVWGINKKGDPEYRKLKTFKTSKEALSFARSPEGQKALEAEWEVVKTRDNVGKQDVRKSDNRPRTGKDYRQGKDVNDAMFQEAFGFKGVEFGEWLKQGAGAKDRQGMLNQTFDALMDLANIIGVPPKAISLNGSLGLALGSRGTGWASAHFEPGNLVINLTKTRGSGTLAHEWFHALDNYFSRIRRDGRVNTNGQRQDSYITYKPEPMMVRRDGRGSESLTKAELTRRSLQSTGPVSFYKPENWHPDPKHSQGVRPEVETHFAELVAALDASPMKARAASIDKGAADGYWSRIIERGARAFENYIITKMRQEGYDNDFLANVREVGDFQRAKARYPYLMPDEVAPIAEAFDNLFGTIETREDDAGNVAMFRADKGGKKISPDARGEAITAFGSLGIKNLEQRGILTFAPFADLPAELQAWSGRFEAKNGTKPVAIHFNGKAYIISDRVSKGETAGLVLHEVGEHYGLERMMGKEAYAKLFSDVRKSKDGSLKAVFQFVEQNYPTLEVGGDAYIAEVIARAGEDTQFFNEPWHKGIVSAVKRFLRVLGFKVDVSAADLGRLVAASLRRQLNAKGPVGIDASFADGQAAVGTKRLAPNGEPSNLNGHQYQQVRTPAFKAWFGDWEKAASAKILQGPPVARLKIEDAPKGSYADVQKWAADLFEKQDGKAVRAGLGEVLLDLRAAKDSMAHGGANAAKKVAFAAVKDVIERGAVIREAREGALDSLYISAPVEISGRENIVTVLVHRDVNTKRMYLHSVSLKENLLNPRVSGADAKASERTGSTDSEDNVTILRDLLAFNPDTVSKVVDENGEPLVVFHGTMALDDFSAFRTNEGEFNTGAHFGGAEQAGTRIENQDFNREKRNEMYRVNKWGEPTPDKNTAGSARVFPVLLSIKNPLRVVDTPSGDVWNRRIAEAISAGHDGLVYSNDFEGDGDSYVAFRPNQIKSAIGNNGYFDPNDDRIQAAARQQQTIPGTQNTPPPLPPIMQPPLGLQGGANGNNPAWSISADSRLKRVRYYMQDKFIDTKDVVKAIRETMVRLSEIYDVYKQETLRHGRIAKRVGNFLRDELNPLVEAAAAAGVKLSELQEYLHARHAEEANKHLDSINPSKAGTGLAGMTDKEADDYLKALTPEQLAKLKPLAAMVDAMIDGTRQTYIGYGLQSADDIAMWKAKYQFYIPLMREQDDGDGSPQQGTGNGISVRGESSKRRTGSDRAVVDILANIAMARENAITRGENNRVGNALLGLAILNPNPDFWKVNVAKMRKTFDKNTGMVVLAPKPNYKGDKSVVVVRRPGKNGEIVEATITFNERNPRAMRMAAALKNMDGDQMSDFVRGFASITRYFASINTRFNPVFAVVNGLRDLQAALVNLSSTPLKGKQWKVFKKVFPALGAIYMSERRDRAGLKPSNQRRTNWEQMQLDGGKTGFRALFFTSEDRAKEIESAFKQASEGKGLRMFKMLAYRAVFNFVSDFNEAIENAARLAVYEVALESGMSRMEAASSSKEITVNFNRKGTVAPTVGAFYAFFNAAVQGTDRMIETLRGPAGVKIALGGIALGVMQTALFAMAGFDEDEPPEFIRERNFIIPIPFTDGKYVAIPYPLGLHVLPNLGRQVSALAMAEDGSTKTAGDRSFEFAMTMLTAFNPIGGGTLLQTAMPTAIDPLMALGENRDWQGRKIFREGFGNSQEPGFKMAKDTATPVSKWLAEQINDVFGGTDYTKPKYGGRLTSPTPDQLDYLFEQATGGVGRETSKLSQSVESAFTGEELPPYKIPLFGRFYGETESQFSVSGEFYNNLDRMARHESEIKGRRKDGVPTADYIAEYPEAKAMLRADYVQRQVAELRKRKREIVAKGAPREEVKKIEERMAKLMQRFNEDVERLSKSKTSNPDQARDQ